jgi:organic radical activating enzyme
VRPAPGPLIVVNEIFGPTVQGEGPSLGQRCGFLRLGGCNLTCRWCDTPYTWDWHGRADTGIAYSPRSELHPMPAEVVAERLAAMDAPLIVISGGEPLSQQSRLIGVVDHLLGLGRRIEVETNGTVVPCSDLARPGVRFNVSPKLAHGGDPYGRRIRPDALKAFMATGSAAFKFVCGDERDLAEVRTLATEFELAPIWIMPKGRTTDEVVEATRRIADGTVEHGWNLTTRLHILAWRDERGR